MIDHAAITKKLHTRYALFVTVVIVALGAVSAYFVPDDYTMPPSRGFVSGWTTALPLPGEVMLGISAALNAGIVALILFINKSYNLVRAVTGMQASLFLIMELATPVVLYTLCPGTLMCLVVLFCVLLIYSIYGQQPCDTRNIFTVFALLSGCSTFDYTYTVYIPIFIFACFQMRVFSLRSFMAIVLGLVTPWIILFGFGIVSPDDLQMPYQRLSSPLFNTPAQSLLMGSMVFTAFVAAISLSRNVVKYIAYNARLRSMVGVVTVITLVTIIAAILDSKSVYNYLVLMDVCAAFQVTHLFTAVHNTGKAYIGVLSLAVIYFILYIFTQSI